MYVYIHTHNTHIHTHTHTYIYIYVYIYMCICRPLWFIPLTSPKKSSPTVRKIIGRKEGRKEGMIIRMKEGRKASYNPSF